MTAGPRPPSPRAVSGQTISELAAQVDGVPGLGLKVEGYTQRRITARYDPAKRVRVSVVVGKAHNATGFKEAGWLAAAIPEAIELEWSNLPALDVRLAEADDGLPTDPRAVAAALKKRSRRHDAVLHCASRFGYRDGQATLRLTVLRTDDGGQIATVRLEGPVGDFRSLVLAASIELAQKTLAAVAGDKRLRKRAGISRKAKKKALLGDSRRFLEGVRLAATSTPTSLRGEVLLKRGARSPPTPRSGFRFRR